MLKRKCKHCKVWFEKDDKHKKVCGECAHLNRKFNGCNGGGNKNYYVKDGTINWENVRRDRNE